jgi:hypothetical protein
LFLGVQNFVSVQTNKAGFECFALLGEVGGSGVPLGFILLKSNKPDANEKEKYLRAAIHFITVDWKIRIKQVLSDKDITEINALLAELPDDIKYQLCFWHCIRAVKTRLCVGTPPSPLQRCRSVQGVRLD